MKNIKDFIQNYIENIPEYTLSDADKKTIQFEGIERFIFKKLHSSKYRSSATSKDYIRTIKKNIHHCVKHQLPIHCSFPFGANKRWNLPTYPGIDWAEVFNIILLREYLAPIAKVYKYGVILRYFSVELFVERTNYVPQKDTNVYEKEFKSLIKYFQKYLPKNFSLVFTNLREQISQKKALEFIDTKVKELRNNWSKLPKKDKDLKIKRARISCMVKPNDPDYDGKILEAVFAHDAFSSECWAEGIPWAFDKDMVTLGHSYTKGWAIHVRSSRSSRINFWVGIGALIDKGNESMPTILSYDQYKKVKNSLQYEKMKLLEDISFNLKQVPVIKK